MLDPIREGVSYAMPPLYISVNTGGDLSLPPAKTHINHCFQNKLVIRCSIISSTTLMNLDDAL